MSLQYESMANKAWRSEHHRCGYAQREIILDGGDGL